MSNKFSRRRRRAKKPPICISKPPPPPPPPYPYPPYGEIPMNDPAWKWAIRSTLPPVPAPPRDPIKIRNLIFHLFPHPGNDAWIHNIQQLKRRWSLFNHRRIIAVAEGPELIPLDRVRDIVGDGTEFLPIQNDPRLRETATFLPLLKRIRSLRTDEATFYAHSKGASQHHTAQDGKQLAIEFWRNRMYAELLDRWPGNGRTLRGYSAIGTLKIDYSRIPN